MSIPVFNPRVYFPIRKAIKENLKKITFRPLKQILFTFDPFCDNVTSVRQLLYHLSSHKVQRTNFLCRIKTNVVNDRSEPTVTFTLNNGENIIIKSANFSTLELFDLYQKYVAVHDVAPASDSAAVLKITKASKGGQRK